MYAHFIFVKFNLLIFTFNNNYNFKTSIHYKTINYLNLFYDLKYTNFY